MNAPILWIGLPGLVSIVLWVLRKREQLVLFSAIGSSVFFMLTSWFIPIGSPIIQIGSFALQINSSVTILGRSFTLNEGDLIFTSLLFLILFLFLSMSFVIEIPSSFIPIGFLIISLFIGALSVQPFLFAALILEICVIFSVIILSTKNSRPGLGVMRFLIFQTMAMPFMLTSGWVLSAIEANPTETKLIIQALILLGLGFSFWLGVFPFNTWMAQLAEENSPFVVAFVLILFNTAITLLIIRYLDGFIWLRDDATIFSVLKIMGILMILSSSILFLFEKKWERTIAYIISFEAGLTLIAMSLNHVNGWNALMLMFLPRILSISAWAASISYIKAHMINERMEKPESAIALIVLGFALFTVAGLPLLPGFTSRLLLILELAIVDMQAVFWLALSQILFISGSIHFLFNIKKSIMFSISKTISRIEYGYFLILSFIFIVICIDPLLIGEKIIAALEAFPNIK